jgi:hypothetical protein
MPAVVVAAPAPIFVDTSQGTPGNPSPTGGVMTVQGENGMVPLGVTGPIQANQGAPNTLANAWPHEITDGTHGPVAVKAANTPAAAADPALVVTMSPDSAYVGVTGPIQVTQPTGPNLQAQVQGLGTAGVPAGNILTIQGVTGATELPVVANDNTATGVLGALNASVSILLAGTMGVGFQLAAGTLVGTIVAELSFDGGTTWNTTFIDNPTTSSKVSSIVFGSSNTATAGTIVGAGGAGLARMRVSAYTSGTANITLRSSQINDPSVLFAGPTGATGAAPPTIAQVGGVDSANTLRAISTDASGRQNVNAFITSPNAQTAGLYAFINAYGTLRVSPEAMAVFIDNFNGTTIDTTNWATPVTSGGGTVTQSSGVLTLAVGTTGGAYAALNSNALFYQDGLGFLIHASLMKMEASTVAGTYRFWGQGTLPGSPAVGTPISDGIGWEVDTSGKLNCVVWQAGTKVFSQNVAKPTDGAWHRYGYFTRPDTTIWYIDSLETPVATLSQTGSASNLGPSTTSLPVLKALYNPASAPGSAPTYQFEAVALADSTNSAVQIADSTYPWRNATINSQGQLAVTSTPTTATSGISPGYTITSAKTNIPLFASTYNVQSSNFTGSIKSSSASDTSAGTGAQTVNIYWINSAGTSSGTETATLNGTTAVNLVTTTKCFIERIIVATVGTNLSNVGAITLYTATGGTGTAVAIVNAADNQTFLAHHHVLSGKSCHITDMTGTTNSSNQALFTIVAFNIPSAGLPELQISDWINGAQTFQVQRTFDSPIVIAGPARIRMYVAPGSTSTLTSYGSFTYYDQ